MHHPMGHGLPLLVTIRSPLRWQDRGMSNSAPDVFGALRHLHFGAQPAILAVQRDEFNPTHLENGSQDLNHLCLVILIDSLPLHNFPESCRNHAGVGSTAVSVAFRFC